MTIAYFDCFAGAGGDMIVAALIDAGADADALAAQLAALGLEDYRIRTETAMRGGLAGRRFIVDVDTHHQPHRHLRHITEMLDRAGLPARADARARDVFTRLAAAEAKVHQCTIEEVHFHEVGAVDSILDIVGACLALEMLGVERVVVAPIPLGRGTIQCDHGTMPVPAPATAELLVGARTVPGDIEGEMTTPTAAAFFTTLAESYGPPPEMDLRAIGWGAGTRDNRQATPNLLRVLIGEASTSGTSDHVMELSANIDDATGEILGATIECLLAAGALDAWATPAMMKKSRPAWVLSVLCPLGDVEAMERLIFSETTTFGVRRRCWERTKLQRRLETVETPYGPVRVKVGVLDGQVMTAAPEFADCHDAARAHHVPVREVLWAARRGYDEQR